MLHIILDANLSMFLVSASIQKAIHMKEDVNMKNEIVVRSIVKLISLPSKLLDDLPPDEQEAIRSCMGKITFVKEIDAYGYFWLGFSDTIHEIICETKEATSSCCRYSGGPTFSVTRECLQLI